MSNLTHWNPFKAMGRADPGAEFDELFRGFGLRPMLRQFEVAPELAMDVSEDAKAYTVRAEIPGVDKKDIDVSVDGNKVAISAEVRRQAEQKDGERLVHAERYYGKVYRAFTVPSEIDAAKVGANYDKGVLTLTLPKRGNGESRKRISVS